MSSRPSSASGTVGEGLEPISEEGSLSPIPPKPCTSSPCVESVPDRVRRVRADLDDIEIYYNIPNAPRRYAKIKEYCSSELSALKQLPFDSLAQSDKVDVILLARYLENRSRRQTLDEECHRKFEVLIPFESSIIALCEARQDVVPIDVEQAAQDLDQIRSSVMQVQAAVRSGRATASPATASRAIKIIEDLHSHVRSWFEFYISYEPAFEWWAATPWRDLDAALGEYMDTIHATILEPCRGSDGRSRGEVFGEPIGRSALLSELSHEMIPYTPEELLSIAYRECDNCEREMKTLSNELGFGDDWKKALDHVKTKSAPVGKQAELMRDLAKEAADYVQHHDLVTVPPLAATTWRTHVMPAPQQRFFPFSFGSAHVVVASPASEMPHKLKAMTRRANNRHFSRALALVESIPGYRLQYFARRRYSTHRAGIFSSPFAAQGWPQYWEMLLWDRGDFFAACAEDRVGALFWRMHRCMRAVFSLRFHLGELTPQQCVEMLVDRVGHERSAAEAEVRRSLEGNPVDGDYGGALYQASYLFGALQLWELRRVVLRDRRMGEKEFHDEVLRAGGDMPVEMLKALLLGEELTMGFQPTWRFCG